MREPRTQSIKGYTLLLEKVLYRALQQPRNGSACPYGNVFMLKFSEWLKVQENNKKPEGKAMSKEAAKLTEKAGTSISKEKLMEILKKSNSKDFSISQSPGSKLTVVVIPV